MSKKSGANIIATGGICVALATASLYFASFVPGVELTLYAASSIFVAVMVEEKGLGGGLMVYAGAAILAFILMPGKLGILPFVFFFGIYPLIKFYAERIKNIPAQFAVKIGCFCVVFFVAYIFFKEMFFEGITLPGKLPEVVIAAGGILMFVVYDYVLTMLIKLYRRRVKGQKGDFKLSDE